MAKKLTSQIAIQLYTLRDFVQTPKDVVKTMKRLRKIGYTRAQISGVGPIDAAELRKMMLGEGVEPMGAHVGLDKFHNELKQVIADCHGWGIAYVAMPWMSPDAVKTAAGWRKMGRELAGYGKKLAAEGITLQYHNHMFEFEKFGVRNGKGGEIGLDILYRSADPKYLQAELDFGWVARAGYEPAAWAKKYKGRLDQVHLKDWSVVNNQPTWRAIGEGAIDWLPVLKACKAAGTKDYIIEQDSCTVSGDPFKSVQISYENLRKMGLK
ncbi:MAG TPA: sugar phosphate isomerase/epimerase [Phycisphaerales bacterium]|nr:sugar phosphate isomerase/epimerase [Phycisphaerales bacterium]